KARIFDPFFTTKATGRGLGLSAVLGIIRGHKGAIRVDSEKGKGTVFSIAFPAGASLAPRVKGQAVQFVDTWKGAGTVLVVDDEPKVREFAQTAPQVLGFKTAAAGDGSEAMEKMRSLGNAVTAVLLHLPMPR